MGAWETSPTAGFKQLIVKCARKLFLGDGREGWIASAVLYNLMAERGDGWIAGQNQVSTGMLQGWVNARNTSLDLLYLGKP